MKIKRQIIMFIFIIFSLLFITGCGAVQYAPFEELNGIPFEYYNTFNYNNETYTLYNVSDEYITIKNGSIFYSYEKYQEPNYNTWTINYIEKYQYKVFNRYESTLTDDEIDFFNQSIQDLLNHYQEKLNINFDLYELNQEIEKEFTIVNNDQYSSIYIMDMYIPFRIEKDNSYNIYIILVPVKTLIFYELNETIKVEYEDVINEEFDINELDAYFNILYLKGESYGN